MGVALKLRRGTTTELNSFQGVSGEMVMDTTTNKVYVFDTASPPVKKEVGDSGLNTYDTNTNELTLDGVVYTITATPVTSSIDKTGLADVLTIGGNTLTLSDKVTVAVNSVDGTAQLATGLVTVDIPANLVSYDPTAGTMTVSSADGTDTSTVVMDFVSAVVTNNNNNLPTYATLPLTGNTLNDTAVWESNNKAYRWTGTQWVTGASDPIPSVASYPLSPTGLELNGQTLLINEELYYWNASSLAQVKWERLTPDQVQLAADIAAAGVETVSSLPVASSSNVDKVVIFNGKLYRNVEDPVGTFTFDKIVLGFDELTGNLAANQITAGTITAGHIGANEIVAGHISAGEIQTGHIGADTIAGDRIATGTLSADRIDTNGISANYLKSGSTAFASGVKFGLGDSQTIAGRQAAGMFGAFTSSKAALMGVNTQGGDAILAGVTGGNGNAVLGVGKGTSTSFSQWESLGALGNGVTGGVFHHYNSSGALDQAVAIADPNFAGYFDGDVHVTGNHYPFTGAHEALIDTADGIVVGDIVVDTEVITKTDISNTLCKVVASSSANQKGAVGIYARGMGDVIPSSLTDIEYGGGGGAKTDKQITTKPEYESLVSSTDAIYINSLGEGQINVCGEGGDLEIGDLIVTSSIQGKGKKQGDDIIRSTTVAKVRENVTFSSSTEVKQIACIYLCG